jgi:hypothetical protein
MKSFLLLLVLFFASFQSFSQDNPLIKTKRKMQVKRTEVPPVIDGFVNDAVWLMAQTDTGFTQLEPNPMVPSNYKTEVSVLYDDQAIYVAFMCYDESGDVVLRQLSERDSRGNTDHVGVYFNSYRDGLNGEGFMVTAAGVQLDEKYSATGDDNSWNAVWDSEVQILDNGWSVEYRIPYAALRFPDQAEQTWVVNFSRSVRRTREESWWDDIDPKIDGYFNQSGELHGIKNIKAPVRLFLYPYVSVNTEHFPNGDANQSNWTRGFNAGMDLKYGINDAFTLDMTLIPDFSQVRSDNQILNLSPFEVQFQENRQFFTEGTELFNKGNLFYSRRIGRTPKGYHDIEDQMDSTEILLSNPSVTQLINSTKVSGRTTKGLGLGFFNAITNSMYAEIQDTITENIRQVKTEPLTNYNIAVLDQNLKNNSYITLINTNTERFDSDRDGNVTGLEFSLNNKTNTYNLSSTNSYSFVSDEDGNTKKGLNTSTSISKVSGNFQFGLWNDIITADYDRNDLGFINQTNTMSNGLYTSYNIFKPFGNFNRARFSISSDISHRFSTKEFQDFSINLNTFFLRKNFFAFGTYTRLEPVVTYDFFEPREDGRYLNFPTNWLMNGFISSDYRKVLALDMRSNFRKFNEEGRKSFYLSAAPRYRASDKLFFVWNNDLTYSWNNVGWIDDENEDFITMGRRDLRTFSSELTAQYIFTNKMGLSFRMRHYWSIADYNKFFLLSDDGSLEPSTYDGFNADGTSVHDVAFNAFNIDLIYNWQFAPGSFMTVVWKNSIFRDTEDVGEMFFDNLGETISADQTNNFSIRVIYFLDYLNIKNAIKK